MEPVFIWKKSVYDNGFHCMSCGVLLFDVAAHAITDNLAVTPVSSESDAPARCACRKCGSPAAVITGYADMTPGLYGKWPAAASEKLEVRMYAVAISTEEAYEWMSRREAEFTRILKEANVKAVHPNPQGRFQAFLYLHAKAQIKGFQILRKYFKTARVITNPAMVDIGQFHETSG